MQMVELVSQVEAAAVGKLLVWIAVGFGGNDDGVRLNNGKGRGKEVVVVDDGVGLVDTK